MTASNSQDNTFTNVDVHGNYSSTLLPPATNGEQCRTTVSGHNGTEANFEAWMGCFVMAPS